MQDTKLFEEKLEIVFQDKNLLKKAFTHRSYINEHPQSGLEHNERLEFLGDAVLELSVTDYLFRKYPEKTEGDLTAYRASLVNTDSISGAASVLGMGDFLLLSKGEAKDIGRARDYILANTFEAFIGALYLDQGYDAANDFILKYLVPSLDEIIAKRLWQDSKSFFQEQSQDKTGITPSYSIVDESGPDHDKSFVVGVYLKDELVAKGEGHSKQRAEQEAARNALKVKGWE